MGIASLIIGVFSILTSGIPMSFGGMGIFLGLIAIILGILGRRRLLEEGRSAGTAVGGLATGVLGLFGGLLNMVLCMTLCGAAASAEDHSVDVRGSSGQDLAGQTAQNISTPATPPTPAIPATPGVPTPSSTGNTVALNTPVTGMFTPGLPTDGEGRPYLDYTFNVATPGTYTINLVSPNPTAYDPFLILLNNGNELARDDDSGGYPNSRISQMLAAGTYTIRVTSFRRQQVSQPAAFSLTVTGG